MKSSKSINNKFAKGFSNILSPTLMNLFILLSLIIIIVLLYIKSKKVELFNGIKINSIKENFLDSSKMYTMAIDDTNNLYYGVLPINLTQTTQIEWLPISLYTGTTATYISYSNGKAIYVGNNGKIYYKIIDSTTNWIELLNSNNIYFTKISFDGYNDNDNYTAMAIDNNTKKNLYYTSNIPNSLTTPTSITWSIVASDVIDISYSNKKAIYVDTKGNLYYNSTPSFETKWVQLLNSNTKGNIFKSVTFDGYNMAAMAIDSYNIIYYATIPTIVTTITPITWNKVSTTTYNNGSLSNMLGLFVGTDFNIWYIPINDTSRNKWYQLLNKNTAGNKFIQISFDNNQAITSSEPPPTTTSIPTLKAGYIQSLMDRYMNNVKNKVYYQKILDKQENTIQTIAQKINDTLNPDD
jgi:hypothetical protein